MFEGLKKGDRVVVAMSGGVDSSVCAAMAQDFGLDTIGITMQLYDMGDVNVKSGKTCCAGQDIYDAKMVAAKIGIPHYTVNYESNFKIAVIDDFVESYMAGTTPIPCIKCNQKLKFEDLLKAAKDLKAKALITGHYVIRHKDIDGKLSLKKGLDEKKDQSYFMFKTTNEQLEYIRFPLGGMTKDQTRDLARKFDLSVSDKKDSQDICFVPGGDYKKVILKHNKNAAAKGDIVDIDGKKIGRHDGVIGYTIGQRKGIETNIGKPLFVIAINSDKNEIMVGDKKYLKRNIIYLYEENWILKPKNDDIVTIKFRSHGSPIPASFYTNGKITYAKLIEAEYGIAKGQACVIYNNEKMLGGGFIKNTAYLD